ncbi:MAG: molybdenum cofactor biosynthesis protein MoaE [Phycisphaerales bacterium]|nr:molybdenum cofactor biosynthesis protein MoaE [Phycisphaerales bacterium]
MSKESTIIEIELVEGPVRSRDWEPAPPGGAECVFRGITRPEHHPDHGDLLGLAYEAHQAMALQQMRELAEEASRRWSPLAIRLHHSTGMVPVGHSSVLIQVIASHRKEAFVSCQWLIDTLKAKVPIWKQETWQQGQTWSEGTPLTTDSERVS